MFKFTIDIRSMQKIMSNAMKVVDKRSAIAILGSVRFEQPEKGCFQLIAATTEHLLRQDLPVSLIDGDFVPFCVSSVELNTIVGSAPGDVIIFSVNEKPNELHVEYLNGKFDLPIDVKTEFPEIETMKESACLFSIPTSDMIPTIKDAVVATSEDLLRPTMSCVYCDVKPDGCIFVGTNGYLLIKKQFYYGAPLVEGTPVDILIPRNIIPAIVNIFACSEEVKISTDDRVMVMTGGGSSLRVTLVEGRYPAYERVIPSSSPYFVTINRKLMISAVRRVSPFTSEASHVIVIRAIGGKLRFNASDIDYNRGAQEDVDIIESNVNDGFAIGMRSEQLLDILGIVSGEEIKLEMKDAGSPMVINENTDKSSLSALIMPMLIQTE